MNRYKNNFGRTFPKSSSGWKGEGFRHSLARQGVRTATRGFRAGKKSAVKNVIYGKNGNLLGSWWELYSPHGPYVDFSKVSLKSPKAIFALSKKIASELKRYSSRLDVVGSIRRGDTSPNDIDMVLIPKDRQKIIAILDKYGTRIEGGEKKLKYNIDGVSTEIYFATPEDYGAMLLTYTGPSGYSIGLRMLAKNKGMKLNQYGLFKDDKLIASRKEEDIYSSLGKKYKPPEGRGQKSSSSPPDYAKSPNIKIKGRRLNGTIEIDLDVIKKNHPREFKIISNESYNKLRRTGVKLNPKEDADGDGVENAKDARPLNPKNALPNSVFQSIADWVNNN
jgi:hypothetical protein